MCHLTLKGNSGPLIFPLKGQGTLLLRQVRGGSYVDRQINTWRFCTSDVSNISRKRKLDYIFASKDLQTPENAV